MSALPHTYLFECICLHNIEQTLWSVVSQANIYIGAVFNCIHSAIGTGSKPKANSLP